MKFFKSNIWLSINIVVIILLLTYIVLSQTSITENSMELPIAAKSNYENKFYERRVGTISLKESSINSYKNNQIAIPSFDRSIIETIKTSDLVEKIIYSENFRFLVNIANIDYDETIDYVGITANPNSIFKHNKKIEDITLDDGAIISEKFSVKYEIDIGDIMVISIFLREEYYDIEIEVMDIYNSEEIENDDVEKIYVPLDKFHSDIQEICAISDRYCVEFSEENRTLFVFESTQKLEKFVDEYEGHLPSDYEFKETLI